MHGKPLTEVMGLNDRATVERAQVGCMPDMIREIVEAGCPIVTIHMTAEKATLMADYIEAGVLATDGRKS